MARRQLVKRSLLPRTPVKMGTSGFPLAGMAGCQDISVNCSNTALLKLPTPSLRRILTPTGVAKRCIKSQSYSPRPWHGTVGLLGICLAVADNSLRFYFVYSIIYLFYQNPLFILLLSSWLVQFSPHSNSSYFFYNILT